MKHHKVTLHGLVISVIITTVLLRQNMRTQNDWLNIELCHYCIVYFKISLCDWFTMFSWFNHFAQQELQFSDTCWICTTTCMVDWIKFIAIGEVRDDLCWMMWIVWYLTWCPSPFLVDLITRILTRPKEIIRPLKLSPVDLAGGNCCTVCTQNS